MSSNQSPVFPTRHFSDYGFDSQFDYFQVLEEARGRQREALSRSIDSFRFKLHKPISVPSQHSPTASPCHSQKKKKKKLRWWNKAFVFFKWHIKKPLSNHGEDDRDVHEARARAFRAAASGPLYMTDCGPTPHRMLGSRPSLSPAGSGCRSPYVSLRELNMEQHWQTMSGSASPIYLVT
uniref:Uncharacterized protein n=1 Tax=Kalanchoe fedtschenkoi TaxID=63787 RepID=A0A7N0T6K8_KALFE